MQHKTPQHKKLRSALDLQTTVIARAKKNYSVWTLYYFWMKTHFRIHFLRIIFGVQKHTVDHKKV